MLLHPRHAAWVAATLVAAIVAPALAADTRSGTDKVRLRLNLEEGRTYRLKTVIDQEVQQEIQGRKVDVDQTMGMDYSFTVEEVKDDGTMTAKVTYRAVTMKQDGPMGKTDYDSDNPPDKVPAAAKGAAALVGETVVIDFSPDGRVTRVVGMDALFEKVMKETELPEGPTKEMLKEQLKKQFGDKAMRESMEQLTAIYPDKPVAVGDSWVRKAKVSKGFPMGIESTYTLKGLKDGVAQVGLKSKITTDPEGEPMKMGPMSMKFDFDGEQEGDIELETRSGWTLRAELNQDFSGKMNMEGLPGTTDAMSWPIRVKGKITVEPVEK